jgi:hypothetical protein
VGVAGAAIGVAGAALNVAGAAAGHAGAALGRIRPQQGSVTTSGLSSRCVDDYECTRGSKADLAAILLEGKIAQATLLAWCAYDDEATFRKATGLEGARLVEYAPEDTQVYVAWLKGGTAVFAFRGTESAKDAATDADARSQPISWMVDTFPKVRGHMGAAPVAPCVACRHDDLACAACSMQAAMVAAQHLQLHVDATGACTCFLLLCNKTRLRNDCRAPSTQCAVSKDRSERNLAMPHLLIR